MAGRKNFPGRKAKRKLEAEARQKRYDEQVELSREVIAEIIVEEKAEKERKQ